MKTTLTKDFNAPIWTVSLVTVFFFAPKDKAMMLVQHLSAKLLKLSPENNSSL
jgi:hypothetical protein